VREKEREREKRGEREERRERREKELSCFVCCWCVQNQWSEKQATVCAQVCIEVCVLVSRVEQYAELALRVAGGSGCVCEFERVPRSWRI
jgi:hypothetical protein